MKDLNIVFAGFGGQGILFAGKVVAYAGLIEGRELSWLCLLYTSDAADEL